MYFFPHKAQIKKDQGLTDEEKPETTDKKRKSGKRKKRHRKKKQVNSHDTPVTVYKFMLELSIKILMLLV